MAGQGPKARALAKEIADGLISSGGPAEGFATCLVSTGGTVLDDGEDVTSPRAATAVKPLVALAYHHRYTTDPEGVKALPNGEAWLASVERADENVRHLYVHRGHNLDISNGHDALVDVSAAKQMTFTGTREELRERLAQLEARGATGIIFGTSGYHVERELRAYADEAKYSVRQVRRSQVPRRRAHQRHFGALLRFVENPRDGIAGFRLMQLVPGIGPVSAQRALDHMMGAADPIRALLDTSSPTRAADCRQTMALGMVQRVDDWGRFVETVISLRTGRSGWPAELACARLWYEPHLERLHDDAITRRADLIQLEQIASGYPRESGS